MPAVTSNFAIVLQEIRNWDATLMQKAKVGFERALLVTVGVIQRKYLSGPRGPATLQNISGRLRNSIVSKVDMDSTPGAEKIKGMIGSNVTYAAFHEFGFVGTERVRAHTRVIGQMVASARSGTGYEAIDNRREVRTRDGVLVGYKDTRKQAASRQRNGVVQVQYVKAHTRKVNYKGRPFVRPALRQAGPLILQEIGKEIAG
jgi:phage gpG-like protein